MISGECREFPLGWLGAESKAWKQNSAVRIVAVEIPKQKFDLPRKKLG